MKVKGDQWEQRRGTLEKWYLKREDRRVERSILLKEKNSVLEISNSEIEVCHFQNFSERKLCWVLARDSLHRPPESILLGLKKVSGLIERTPWKNYNSFYPQSLCSTTELEQVLMCDIKDYNLMLGWQKLLLIRRKHVMYIDIVAYGYEMNVSFLHWYVEILIHSWSWGLWEALELKWYNGN